MMQTYHVTTLTALSSGIAIVAIFAWLYGFFKVYSNYKQSNNKQSLYFSIAILFGAFAIICLALELTTLQLFDNKTIAGQNYNGSTVIAGINSSAFGFGFAYLAILLSAIAILFFDAFSLSFFENKMKYLIIPLILLLSYVIVYLWPNLPVIQLNNAGTDYNPAHTVALFNIPADDILVALFILPIFFPAIIFLLSGIQSRGNRFDFLRKLSLSFTQILLGVGYTIEIVGPENAYLPIIGRIFILLYPYLTWNILQKSSWVRKLLGGN